MLARRVLAEYPREIPKPARRHCDSANRNRITETEWHAAAVVAETRMRLQRKGLAQFFGGKRAETCIQSIAEKLCLTLLKQGRPSNRVNGYDE